MLSEAKIFINGRDVPRIIEKIQFLSRKAHDKDNLLTHTREQNFILFNVDTITLFKKVFIDRKTKRIASLAKSAKMFFRRPLSCKWWSFSHEISFTNRCFCSRQYLKCRSFYQTLKRVTFSVAGSLVPVLFWKKN